MDCTLENFWSGIYSSLWENYLPPIFIDSIYEEIDDGLIVIVNISHLQAFETSQHSVVKHCMTWENVLISVMVDN